MPRNKVNDKIAKIKEEEVNPHKLKHRHRAFVYEYCRDWCGGPAAIRAGYATKGAVQRAYTLLAHPEIAAAIEKRAARIAAISEVDSTWLMDRLKYLAENARTESVQLGALTQIAKNLGLSLDRVDLTSNGQTVDGGVKQVMIFGGKPVEF